MPELSPQRWLIYALGGGLGHFHRAIAMGRAATSRGHYIKILTNDKVKLELSPYDLTRGRITYRYKE